MKPDYSDSNNWQPRMFIIFFLRSIQGLIRETWITKLDTCITKNVWADKTKWQQLILMKRYQRRKYWICLACFLFILVVQIPATRAPTATQNVPTCRINSNLLTSSLRELKRTSKKFTLKSSLPTYDIS